MEAIGWAAEVPEPWAVDVPVPDDEDLECTLAPSLRWWNLFQMQEMRNRRQHRHIDLVCRAIRSKR